jgi:hypothetical protein
MRHGEHHVGGHPLALVVHELHVLGLGADHGPEGGVDGRHDARDPLDALLDVGPPPLLTTFAFAKPSMTTAPTPRREKTRLATRPATPPKKSTTMVAPAVFSRSTTRSRRSTNCSTTRPG